MELIENIQKWIVKFTNAWPIELLQYGSKRKKQFYETKNGIRLDSHVR